MYAYYIHTIDRQRAEIAEFFAEIGAGLEARLCDDVVQLWQQLCLWQRRDRLRRNLAAMEPRLLDDMGISHRAAAKEAGKPFWRA